MSLERQLSIPFFVDEEHANGFIEAAEQQVLRLRQLLPDAGTKDKRTIEAFGERLTTIKNRPVLLRSILDGRPCVGKIIGRFLLNSAKKFFQSTMGVIHQSY